jgi:hypothetical protein
MVGRLPAVPAAATREADRTARRTRRRMADLPAATAAITKIFLPRFTPHLTHRQEAPKGASCPPQISGRRWGKRVFCSSNQPSEDAANNASELAN